MKNQAWLYPVELDPEEEGKKAKPAKKPPAPVEPVELTPEPTLDEPVPMQSNPDPSPAPMEEPLQTPSFGENGAAARESMVLAGASPAKKPKPTWGLFRWFFVSVVLLFVGLLLEDTALFLRDRFAAHWSLGLFFSILIAGVTSALMLMVGREWLRIRRLRTHQGLREEAERLVQSATFGQAQPLTKQIAKLYRERPQTATALERFNGEAESYLGDREMLQLFSHHLLVPLDREAYGVVVKNSTAAAVFATISPLAWLDALLFLWRNVRMVRELAEVYGIQPGFTGSMVMIRSVFQGMLVSGAAELLVDEGAVAMGESFTSLLLAQAGQGVANGLFTARVGLYAMRYCRPIPFEEKDRPKLAYIRGEVIGELKKVLKKSDNPKIPGTSKR
ncbi:MAG: TIGR01620 family protein [Magnetococcales bacterium]|nr:TIGR01620 family protein [Magnetococcales bacterium]